MSESKPHRQPKIVCLCGSGKFPEAFRIANRELTLAGWIVVAPGVNVHRDGIITNVQKERLDELHFRKIDLASHIVILNVGRYIGESTRREQSYAVKTGKDIFFLESSDDASRLVDIEQEVRELVSRMGTG